MIIRRFFGLKIIVVFVIVIFSVAEIATRLSGIFDFPIYKRSEKIGYYLAPSQHGSFLNKNKWYVNAQGFNNNQPFSSTHPYTILVGDSVVYGGNPVDYDIRVGTVASKLTRQNIWVAAAGGWSLYNELAYISSRKEIVKQANNLVIVYDNGDLSGLAPWQGEYTHPTQRPIFAFPYVMRRYILPHFFSISPPNYLLFQTVLYITALKNGSRC